MNTEPTSSIADMTTEARLGRLEKVVDGVRSDVGLIKTAIIGNDLGTRGLAPRLDIVEEKTENLTRKLIAYGTAVAIGGGTVAAAGADFIKALLHQV